MEALRTARARLARDILLRSDALHLAAWQDVMAEELPAMREGPDRNYWPHDGFFDMVGFEKVVGAFARGQDTTLYLRGVPGAYDFQNPSVEMIEALQTLLVRELGSRDKLRGMAQNTYGSTAAIYALATEMHAAAAGRIRWLIDGAVGAPPPPYKKA